jgi:hypothetical protein
MQKTAHNGSNYHPVSESQLATTTNVDSIFIPRSLTDCLYQHLDNYKPPSVMAVFTDSLLKIDIDIDIGDGSQGLPNEIFINRTNFTPVVSRKKCV